MNTEFVTHTVELAGETFGYRDAGDPSAPPVVLLHAATKDSSSWEGVAKALAERYRVVAPDLRGHGASPRNGPYALEHLRDDVWRFTSALDLDGFVLVGHSMGGTFAYLFAEEYPHLLSKLVLEDAPAPLPGREWQLPQRPPADPEDLPFDVNCPVSVIGQLNDPKPDWGRLDRITVPTLVIGGGAHLAEPDLARLDQLVPDCRTVMIEGAGHHVHESRPAEFLAALTRFLEISAASR